MEISGPVRIGLPPLREKKNIRTVNLEHQVDTGTQPGQLRFQRLRLRYGEMEYVFQRQKTELGLSHSRKAHLLNASA